eukprot:gnl/Carplike_NY0171/1606_a2170_576.p1 GENE.gnl/Carplike_NY0171/1606_a2170_576~~gnl/Carplike_NY0171/1606_a2170_576.p1  ORF type:complete len:565 (+),score=118.04 gnl/Carplike_NY0171/1606_a2170_576:73-1695(+)
MARHNSLHSTKDTYVSVFSRYKFCDSLGKGSYGIVYKAFDKRTKKYVAIKKVKAFGSGSISEAQKVFREIYFLKSFKHFNIVRLLNVVKADNDDCDVYLVFELMNSDLRSAIKSKALQPIHIKYIMFQLVASLAYIHSGDVIHCDVKPANVLLNEKSVAKMADFGLSQSIGKDRRADSKSKHRMPCRTGTRWYSPPELLVASSKCGKAIDMWSLGCTFAEMLLGRPLFPGSDCKDQLTRIMKFIGCPSSSDISHIKSSCSHGYLTSIFASIASSAMISPVISPRSSTLPQIESSESLMARFSRSSPSQLTIQNLSRLLPAVSPDAIDFLARLLLFCPDHRMTALDALHHPYLAAFTRESGSHSVSSPLIPVPLLPSPVILPLCDQTKYSISKYKAFVFALAKRTISYDSLPKSSSSCQHLTVESFTSSRSDPGHVGVTSSCSSSSSSSVSLVVDKRARKRESERGGKESRSVGSPHSTSPSHSRSTSETHGAISTQPQCSTGLSRTVQAMTSKLTAKYKSFPDSHGHKHHFHRRSLSMHK